MARNRKAAYQKKRQNRMSVILIVFVLAMLMLAVGAGETQLREKQRAYIQQEEELQKKIDAEKARAQELEEYEKYTQTQKFKEDLAKEKLGLVHDNEIVFKETE